ncbi:hypothetical protein C2G38_2259594 [Gigaspora rosea]|uniref:MD-2-related lipid-recognition domain-containing protein n=1 Tax=Gigaspora rosea TaxID=44941 RepID=A0A397UXJ1_9GLOM|nr:hypothetical protein C2G38_2259594 [Gigaspora rosea]
MKKFIYAYILFALLLTVNAAPFQLNKRAITFVTCDDTFPSTVLNVKIGSDHPESKKNESFEVSGKLTYEPIVKDITVLRIEYSANGNTLGDIYDQVFSYSVEPRTPFNISASDVPTPELPDSYMLYVYVGEYDRMEGFFYESACALATVSGSS